MAAPEKFNEYLREIRFLHRALFGMIVVVLVLGVAFLRFPRPLQSPTAPPTSPVAPAAEDLKALVRKIA